MFTAISTPTRKSKTPKVSRRVKPVTIPVKAKVKVEILETPVTWRENLHYEVEFKKWLKENAGPEAVNLFEALSSLGIFAGQGIGPNGHVIVRRTRNRLQKMLPKFKPEE
jgi:hypothetical protein